LKKLYPRAALLRPTDSLNIGGKISSWGGNKIRLIFLMREFSLYTQFYFDYRIFPYSTKFDEFGFYLEKEIN
jgi:hypothetical protein